jgi:hypothetical protein
LLDALRCLGWLDDGVLDAASRIVRDAAEDFLDFCDKRIALFTISSATAHRNLAVLAPTTALPMLRLAWGVGADIAEERPDCDFHRWTAFLDARARRRGVWLPFRHLLDNPPRLAARDVVALFPTVDLTRFRMLLRAGAGDDVTRRLRRAIHHCPGVTPLQLAFWCREAWTLSELPRLSRDAFDTLPRSLRRAFLADSPGIDAVRAPFLMRTSSGVARPAARTATPRRRSTPGMRSVPAPPSSPTSRRSARTHARCAHGPETLPDAGAVVELLTPDVVRQLLGPEERARGWFVWGLCGELLALGPGRFDALARFLRCSPTAYPRCCWRRFRLAVRLGVRPTLYRVARPGRGAAARACADRTDAHMAGVAGAVAEAAACGAGAAAELATSGSEDDLRDAFRAYPDAFADQGPALFPLRRLLRFAFGNVGVARVVERHFPREQLTAELDWVRQRWMNTRPSRQQLELALCFSLRDARFLCQLARPRSPSRPPREPWTDIR